MLPDVGGTSCGHYTRYSRTVHRCRLVSFRCRYIPVMPLEPSSYIYVRVSAVKKEKECQAWTHIARDVGSLICCTKNHISVGMQFCRDSAPCVEQFCISSSVAYGVLLAVISRMKITYVTQKVLLDTYSEFDRLKYEAQIFFCILKG